MKILIIPSALLMLGISVSSCDSCNKKHENPDSTATNYTDTTAAAASADTTDVSSANDATPVVSASASSGNSKPNSTVKSAKIDDKSTNGYSAPDGTEAENHDGDQYTRNDEKPRPTGPPIK